MKTHKIKVLFIILCIAVIVILTSQNRDTVYVWPLWGIGNRLRTIRVCYALARQTGKDLALIEHDDDGFQGSMARLFGHPFRSVSKTYFTNVLCRTQTISMFEFNQECALAIDKKELTRPGSICIKACEVKIDNAPHLMKDRSVYAQLRLQVPSECKRILSDIVRTKAVGVHVRQGNVNDWERGYFFNDEWKGIRERDPTSAPLMCCFEDGSKNLSACTSNVTHLEKYIEKMKEFPKTTNFFICSDRPGCLLYLHQIFPDRILSNPPSIEAKTVDTKAGMKDFVCLANCTKIICSQLSTFCNEASRVNDIPVLFCRTR